MLQTFEIPSWILSLVYWRPSQLDLHDLLIPVLGEALDLATFHFEDSRSRPSSMVAICGYTEVWLTLEIAFRSIPEEDMTVLGEDLIISYDVQVVHACHDVRVRFRIVHWRLWRCQSDQMLQQAQAG